MRTKIVSNFFLCFVPSLIIILNNHFNSYIYSLFVGLLLSFLLRLPLNVFCFGYLWASAISILIGNWHISISSEPYIVNLLGDGADDKSYAEAVLDPFFNGRLLPYPKMLKFFLKPLDIFSQISFYNLLSINCLFHSLGASAMLKIIRKFDLGLKAEKFGFYSYLFFPILLIDGLTLMRDGIISSLTTILIYCLFSFGIISIQSTISFLSLSFLRIGSGLLFIVNSLITLLLTLKKLKFNYKLLTISLFFGISIIFFGEKIIDYLIWKEMFSNFFIRSGMENEIIANLKEANINILLSLPSGIKQFSLFLYFLFAPFGSPFELFKGDSYLFFSSLFSFWNIVSIKLCSQDFFYQIKNYKTLENRNYFRIIIFFVLGIYIIANYSIQLRHKSLIYPVQILLTCHSLKKNKVFDYSLTWLVTLPYILLLFL